MVLACIRYMGVAFEGRPELNDIRKAFTAQAEHLAKVTSDTHQPTNSVDTKP